MMDNKFVTSETDAPNGFERTVKNLNQNHNNCLVVQRIEQKKQEDEKAVQSSPTLGIDWGEKGDLNNSNRGFQLLR